MLRAPSGRGRNCTPRNVLGFISGVKQSSGHPAGCPRLAGSGSLPPERSEVTVADRDSLSVAVLKKRYHEFPAKSKYFTNLRRSNRLPGGDVFLELSERSALEWGVVPGCGQQMYHPTRFCRRQPLTEPRSEIPKTVQHPPSIPAPRVRHTHTRTSLRFIFVSLQPTVIHSRSFKGHP